MVVSWKFFAISEKEGMKQCCILQSQTCFRQTLSGLFVSLTYLNYFIAKKRSPREQDMRAKPGLHRSNLMWLVFFTYALNFIQIRNYVDGNREIRFTRKLKKSNNKEFSSMA